MPFVLQIVGTVGLVGYISYENGRKAINDIAAAWHLEVTERIQQYLGSYFSKPHTINQINANAIRLGLLDVQNPELIKQSFWQYLQTVDTVSAIYLGNEQGGVIAVGRLPKKNIFDLTTSVGFAKGDILNYTLDSTGKPISLSKVLPDMDVRTQPWYVTAKQAGEPAWSEIFPKYTDKDLAIAAVYPIYNTKGQFQGVLGCELLFLQVNKFLRSLRIGQTGETFIIERSGKLISSSTLAPVVLSQNGELKSIAATDSDNPVISQAAKRTLRNFGSFTTIKRNQRLDFKDVEGKRQFVQVAPLRDEIGLDWLIFVVVPEVDFMEQINVNTRTTILLCITALVVAIFVGILTARWVTKPIVYLNAAVAEIAQGKFDHPVTLERTDELGELASAFKHMAAQLQKSFAWMQTLNEALSKSESRLIHLLEALPVGVAVHNPDGTVNYLNKMAKQLLGKEVIPEATAAQLAAVFTTYIAGTDQLYPTEQLPILCALRGESVSVEDIEIRPHGKAVLLEVRARPIFDDTGKIIYAIAVFQDIAKRKQAEKVLANYNSALETQVAERTEALRESEERFRNAFETAAIGMCLISPEGQFLAVNASVCQMFGYSESELLSLNCKQITYPDDLENDLLYVQQMLAGKIPYYHLEKRYIHKQGTIIWTTLSASLVKDKYQKPLHFVSQIQDITERKQAEEKLRYSEELFRQLAENLREVFWIANEDTASELLYVSPAYEKTWGFTRPNLLQDLKKQWNSSIHPEDLQRLNAVVTELQGLEIEYRIIRADGSLRWIRDRGFPIYNEQGQIYRFVGIAEDITERKQAEEKLLQASLRDALTGLPNRTLFNQRLAAALKRYMCQPQHIFAVLFLDLDRFKLVNDSLGHAAGDTLLIEIANRLSSCLSSEDTVARLGGDEFVLLLEVVHDIRDALDCATRIQQTLVAPFELLGTTVSTSASIGIAMVQPHYTCAGEILRDADIAMYEAKAAGRGQCQVFDPQMHESAKMQLQQEQELRQALNLQQLQVVYQPIVTISTQELLGFEALVRWQHPQRGQIVPAKFLAVAEQAGLLVAIDLWVLQTACEQLVQWQKLQTKQDLPLSISVNVSSPLFAQKDLESKVAAILMQTELPPECLKLEITEGVIMENANEGLDKLQSLKALGVQLNIDDFGTGYSSLSRLHQLPINALKIDQSFVKRLGKSSDSLEIIRAIITLAQTLRIEVIAEGVETEQQKQQLQMLSCQQGQGYLFSVPLNSTQAQKLIG